MDAQTEHVLALENEIHEQVVSEILESANESPEAQPSETTDSPAMMAAITEEIADTVAIIESGVTELQEQINTQSQGEGQVWNQILLNQETQNSQLSAIVTAVSGLQTTITELMLSQNQMITEIAANQKPQAETQAESEAQTDTKNQETLNQSPALQEAGHELEAVAEAVSHPVVSQEPGKRKRNWI